MNLNRKNLKKEKKRETGKILNTQLCTFRTHCNLVRVVEALESYTGPRPGWDACQLNEPCTHTWGQFSIAQSSIGRFLSLKKKNLTENLITYTELGKTPGGHGEHMNTQSNSSSGLNHDPGAVKLQGYSQHHPIRLKG